jgi:hypothetical protein
MFLYLPARKSGETIFTREALEKRKRKKKKKKKKLITMQRCSSNTIRYADKPIKRRVIYIYIYIFIKPRVKIACLLDGRDTDAYSTCLSQNDSYLCRGELARYARKED